MVLHGLNHGHRLTAIAVYRYETIASREPVSYTIEDLRSFASDGRR